jgi:hypothetical protein
MLFQLFLTSDGTAACGLSSFLPTENRNRLLVPYNKMNVAELILPKDRIEPPPSDSFGTKRRCVVFESNEVK